MLILIQSHLYKTLVSKEIIPNVAFSFFKAGKMSRRKRHLLLGRGDDFRLSCLCTWHCPHCSHCLELPPSLSMWLIPNLSVIPRESRFPPRSLPDPSEEAHICLLCASSSPSPSAYSGKQIYSMPIMFYWNYLFILHLIIHNSYTINGYCHKQPLKSQCKKRYLPCNISPS